MTVWRLNRSFLGQHASMELWSNVTAVPDAFGQQVFKDPLHRAPNAMPMSKHDVNDF
jgi:hypothetical protein